MTRSYGSGQKRVDVSNADRVLFPGAELTKGDLVDYYASVADLMLPHITDRPLTLRRAPNGLEGEAFFQQNVSDHFPSWIKRAPLERREGGIAEHPVGDSRISLIYLANQGCITFHAWTSKTDDPERPDRVVFDLDPSDDDFEKVREGALHLKEIIDEIGLVPFVKTTGSRGIHVFVPIKREYRFDDVREFAKSLADVAVSRHPGLLTAAQRKANRGARVYVDFLRNSYGQSAVAPYSARLRPGAPVSMPITWTQLEDRRTGPQTFTIENIHEHINEGEDPWSGISRRARSLSRPREKLRELVAA